VAAPSLVEEGMTTRKQAVERSREGYGSSPPDMEL